jgi:prepilin peptidase CpaA
MSLPPFAIRIFLEVLVIVAAIWDIRTRRIPNWLTLSGVVLAIAINTFIYQPVSPWFGAILSLKGMALGFGAYFVLYLLRAMGAGDVKLMAAVGAAAGWENWLGILVLTSVAGAVAGLLLVAFKGRFRKTLGNLGLIISSLGRGRAPYKN